MDKAKRDQLIKAIEAVGRIAARLPPDQRDCLLVLSKSPATTIEMTDYLKKFSAHCCRKLKRKGFVDFQNGRWFLTEHGQTVLCFVRSDANNGQSTEGK